MAIDLPVILSYLVLNVCDAEPGLCFVLNISTFSSGGFLSFFVLRPKTDTQTNQILRKVVKRNKADRVKCFVSE